MNITWDAEKYTKDFSFVHQYGNGVLELISTGKAKTAIDLGCGNGALSRKLKDMGLDVIGIDSSPEQLGIARKNYPDIPFIEADAASFSVDDPVDHLHLGEVVVDEPALLHRLSRFVDPLAVLLALPRDLVRLRHPSEAVIL